jgi:hypothetical protein
VCGGYRDAGVCSELWRTWGRRWGCGSCGGGDGVRGAEEGVEEGEFTSLRLKRCAKALLTNIWGRLLKWALLGVSAHIARRPGYRQHVSKSILSYEKYAKRFRLLYKL